MRVGFYFEDRHLNQWTWLDFINDKLALSGTDSQILCVAYGLAKRGHDCFFFSSQDNPDVGLIHNHRVADLPNAVLEAKKLELDILVFCTNCGYEKIQESLHIAEKVDQMCLVWCQNFHPHELYDLLAESKVVRRLICVSMCQVDLLRDHPIFSKTTFIYNSIEPAQFEQYLSVDRDPLNVCYLGSLTVHKGFHHLAKAWVSIHQQFPDAKLLVIGSAKLYDRNLELGPLGVSDKEFENFGIIPYLGATTSEVESMGVRFLGLVPREKIREIISHCSIGVINPSLDSPECCSISSLEMQACGIPIIGGNCGGNRETIRYGQTGFLVKDQQELIKAICVLLKNPLMARDMGVNGHRWVAQDFNSDLVLQQWASSLEAAIQNRKLDHLKFSWKRADASLILRETIRRSRSIPLIGKRIPTLYKIRNLATSHTR